MMTLKAARKRWAKRRAQYAVGYIDSGNLIFVDPVPGGTRDGGEAGRPISLKKAKLKLASMPSPGAAIFRLVPIAIGGGRKR